jgi:uncharacterized paraquat-inducible protein A
MAWEYLNEDDELEDREFPDEHEDDNQWSDEDVYFACPECGADVYEEAPQCPACGCYVSHAPRTALPIRWKIVAVVILIAFAIGLLWTLL